MIHAKIIGKTLEDINFHDNYQVKCVAIKRDEDTMLSAGNMALQENDILFIIGFNETLEALSKEF